MTKKIQTAGAILLGLSVAAVLTLAPVTAGACDGEGKTTASKVSNESGCGSKGAVQTAKASGASGCASVKQASTDGKSCAVAGKAAGSCASLKTASAGSSCCASKNSATTTASTMFPEGTEVTKVSVDGGVDLIFTGKDLAAIEKALSEHAKACATDKQSCANKCTVTKTENSVVMAVRGESPESCCAGMMVTVDDKVKSDKTVVKKS